jgi:signal transduction histidine kinase
LSNLLTNALTHGAGNSPVRVEALNEHGVFTLSVKNRGTPISAETRSRLFQPYSRTPRKEGNAGLGLGLYIASEIARSHNGTLSVESHDDETAFLFKMPSSNQ